MISLNSVPANGKIRSVIDGWWNRFKLFADTNFLDEFSLRQKFSQRCWELYLGATLISRGFQLKESQPNSPDFGVFREGTIVWIEATSVGKGTGVDCVPDTVLGQVYGDLSPKLLLRLTSGIRDKHEALLRYISSGAVQRHEPFVIAINRSETERVAVDLEMPLILKALFGIGYPQIEIDLLHKEVSREIKWSARPEVIKQNDSRVPMLIFEDETYSGISGIVYCTQDCFNGPHLDSQLGENLLFVHNPLATNPLPMGFFPFGSEYVSDGEFLKKIRSSQNYEPLFELREESVC